MPLDLNNISPEKSYQLKEWILNLKNNQIFNFIDRFLIMSWSLFLTFSLISKEIYKEKHKFSLIFKKNKYTSVNKTEFHSGIIWVIIWKPNCPISYKTKNEFVHHIKYLSIGCQLHQPNLKKIQLICVRCNLTSLFS